MKTLSLLLLVMTQTISVSSVSIDRVRAYQNANFTNATTTFTNTGLSVPVEAGRKYALEANILLSDSTAADGAKVDFAGGTANVTDFRVHCVLLDTALLFSAQSTTLGTSLAQGTVTGSAMITCNGSIEPSASGTLVIRAAQNAHTTGTLTVFRGSFLTAEVMP